MKQFFEQYGGIALGILALLVLIAMITPVGNIIKTSLQGTTHKFSTQINTQADDMSNQMIDIMNSAGDFLNIKADGKMYKGDVLYTGWDGDKAYLEGVENPVGNNYEIGLYWQYNGIGSIRTEQSFIDANLDPDMFNVISFKIDDVVLYENFKGESMHNLKASIGVSTFETIVTMPSNFSVGVSASGQAKNYKKEVISDNGTSKIVRLSGIINQTNGGPTDINIDDLRITKDY